jgi:hypothetical protein
MSRFAKLEGVVIAAMADLLQPDEVVSHAQPFFSWRPQPFSLFDVM